MLMVLILLILLILLLVHLLILPLSQRRPIFIKGLEGALFFAVFFAVIAVIIHPIIYIFVIAISVFVYYTKLWIVYGVSRESIRMALDKAISATRSTSVKIGNEYRIDNSMLIKIDSLGSKVCYIQYKTGVFSKKSELTKEVFRKFIQNYFI